MSNMLKRIPVRMQEPRVRVANFEEVSHGYNIEEALKEAQRCLNCKNAKCIKGCPASVNIPEFIRKLREGKLEEAYEIIGKSSSFPSICGRVCPQEFQCEKNCIRGIRGEAVSIGALERFVADYALERGVNTEQNEQPNGHKVAVIGSGPAGLACSGDLVGMGYDVTVFEALQEPGGVLLYGIPKFRLPKETVLKKEIEKLGKAGVKFRTNVMVGKDVTIDQLMEEEKYEAVFIGTGADRPRKLNIPGEEGEGVYTANAYLAKLNLDGAGDTDRTPMFGKKIAVVGGGNVAMDVARTSVRFGADVRIIYRRTEAELPARKEEILHVKEEGILFEFLADPKEILRDDEGKVKGLKLLRMRQGDPDESGRRKSIAIPGSEYDMEADVVVLALGTVPGSLISSTTKGLKVDQAGGIVTEEEYGRTTKAAVFAGGDAVSGAATVILAMVAGKKAAKGIHEYLSGKS